MVSTPLDPHPFLSPAEVGALLKVRADTVVGWSKAGRLRCVFTASGRRLYLKADIVALHPELAGIETAPPAGHLVPAGGGREGTGRADRPSEARYDSTVEASAVAEAVLIAAEADAEMAREAVELAAEEVLVAARTVAVAAARAHEAREFASVLAADAVVVAVEHAAEVERTRAVASAERVSRAADEAARLVLGAAGSRDLDDEARETAGRLASLVQATAAATAQESDVAATSRAEAADDAAVQLALMIKVTDRACEQEVELAAAALEATATATRLRLAATTKVHVEGTASRAHRIGIALMRPQ